MLFVEAFDSKCNLFKTKPAYSDQNKSFSSYLESKINVLIGIQSGFIASDALKSWRTNNETLRHT